MIIAISTGLFAWLGAGLYVVARRPRVGWVVIALWVAAIVVTVVFTVSGLSRAA